MRLRPVLLAAATVMATLPLLLAGPPAGAASPLQPSIQLLGQTPWLVGKGIFGFRVSVALAGPGDRLEVTVFDQLITRTAFDAAAAGHVFDGYFYQQALPLSALPADRAGGADVDLPINQPPAAGPGLPAVPIGETGVFPVQLTLVDSKGATKGTPLTTFIVFTQQTVSAGQLHPLAAAVVIPYRSSSYIEPPSPGEADRLDRLASVLNDDVSVPVSLLASPATIDALSAGGAAGSATDRRAVANLAGVAGGPVQILPSTYSQASLADLSELPGEVDHQLDAGTRALTAALGTNPVQGTWAVDGPLDSSTVAELADRHVTRVIVPNSDLTALPNEVTTTFARSTWLASGGQQIQVVAADPTLTADFTRDEPPVLAANQLLAEMAMIYTETPGIIDRGVAVMPPADWSASPDFLATLLAGLDGNPLVRAVTASGLFGAVGDPQGTRYLQNPAGNASTPPGWSGIAPARSAIDRMRAVLPSESTEVAAADRDLLLAESADITAAQRAALLAAVARITGRVEHAVTLPPSTTITLTSTRGAVPITILTAGNLHPTIELVLTSQRLIFRAFSPPSGTCTVLSEVREICTLSIKNQNTTLKVPVETRTSGVFPIDVYLYPPGSPNGSRWLAHDQDTVRSTAVSGVALFLIGGALLALVLWWGRDLRRGRRPKGMVPAPSEPHVTHGDPRLDEFFQTRPPDYGPGAMSPSGRRTGPSETTDTYGPGRETRG